MNIFKHTKFIPILFFIFFSSEALFASKRIVVDLTHQIAIAYQDGKVKFYGRISSGKPGRRTPTGSFYVREKDINHVSNLWPKPNGGAKMHYMLRITRDGVAMHLGPTPNYPASHGCIRMQNGFAQRMYAWAEKWTKVDIIGSAPAHSPAVRLPAYAKSPSMLRRSVGSSMGSALSALSSNPKDHKRSTTSTSKSSSKKNVSRHYNPLSAISSNPKDRLSTKKRSSKRKKYRKRSKANKRYTKKRNKLGRKDQKRKNRNRNRHANPLKAIS